MAAVLQYDLSILLRIHKNEIIECDREKSFKLVEKMHDTVIIHGDARDIDLLKEECIRDTDAFIASYR